MSSCSFHSMLHSVVQKPKSNGGMHENSVGLSSTTNPKPKGVTIRYAMLQWQERAGYVL